MPNRTVESGLVEPVASAGPMSGHDIVVFQCHNGSHRYQSTIEDRKPHRMQRLFSSRSLAAYAVPAGREHWFRIDVDNLTSSDQEGPFSLKVDLYFNIKEPRSLVERLDSDPLSALERHAQQAVVRATRRMKWTTIEKDEEEFERDIVSIVEDGIANSFKDFGLSLARVSISRFFSQKYIDVARAHRQAKQEIELADAKQVLEKHNQQLRHQIEILEERHKTDLEAIARRSLINQGILNGINIVIAQISEKIRTVPDLQRSLNDLKSVQQDLIALASDSKHLGALETELLESSSTQVTSPRAPLIHLVKRGLDLVGDIECEEVARARFLSCFVHLLAELLLPDGEVEAEGFMVRLNGQADNLLEKVNGPGQRNQLLEIIDRNWIRSTLAGRGGMDGHI